MYQSNTKPAAPTATTVEKRLLQRAEIDKATAPLYNERYSKHQCVPKVPKRPVQPYSKGTLGGWFCLLYRIMGLVRLHRNGGMGSALFILHHLGTPHLQRHLWHWEYKVIFSFFKHSGHTAYLELIYQ